MLSVLLLVVEKCLGLHLNLIEIQSQCNLIASKCGRANFFQISLRFAGILHLAQEYKKTLMSEVLISLAAKSGELNICDSSALPIRLPPGDTCPDRVITGGYGKDFI